MELLFWLKQYYETYANRSIVYDAIGNREKAMQARIQLEQTKRKPAINNINVMPSAKRALMNVIHIVFLTCFK